VLIRVKPTLERIKVVLGTALHDKMMVIINSDWQSLRFGRHRPRIFLASRRLVTLFQQPRRSAVKALGILTVLTVWFFVVLSPCPAKRAYMWTDRNGVSHISDQPPPQGVDAKSFSTEREHPGEEKGAPEEAQKPEGQSSGSTVKNEKNAKPIDSNPANNTGADSTKAKYRDPSTFTRTENMELLILKTSRERAERLHNSASSEEERTHWNAVLDRMKADEKKILEVPGR
jgi:hypothetical protein